jgi:hypothetical protein
MTIGETIRELRVLLPLVVEVIAIAAIMAVVALVVKLFTERKWRYNIKHFLPELAREQVTKRDLYIQELSAKVDNLEAESAALRATLRGAIVHTSKVMEILATTRQGQRDGAKKGSDLEKILQIVESKRNLSSAG